MRVCLLSHITHICVWATRVPESMCMCKHRWHHTCLAYTFKRAAFACLKSPRGSPSTYQSQLSNCCNAHIHGEFSFAFTHTRTRSSKRPSYRSLLVFLHSAVQILWLVKTFQVDQSVKTSRQLGVGLWLCITWTMVLSWPQSQHLQSDWTQHNTSTFAPLKS